MAKKAAVIETDKDVQAVILAGRHPHTEAWNQPGYLNEDEWSLLGSGLTSLVKTLAQAATEDERAKIIEDVAKAGRAVAEAQQQITDMAQTLANTKALLKGEQQKTETLDAQVILDGKRIQSLNAGIKIFEAGLQKIAEPEPVASTPEA